MTCPSVRETGFDGSYPDLIPVCRVGFLISLGLLILQYPILKVAFTLIDATEEVKQWASLYFNICIWGAPAVLGLYGFAGWFIGMQNSRFPMFIAIAQNIVNIVASLCFVFVLGMKVEGVALGTLIAQYAGLLMAFALWLKYYKRLKAYIDWNGLGVGRRCVASSQSIVIYFSGPCAWSLLRLSLLLQVRDRGCDISRKHLVDAVIYLVLLYNGWISRYAGEALAGRFIGAKNDVGLRKCIRLLFLWGIGLSLSFTILYALGGKNFLGLLTNDTSVIEASGDYFYWVLAIPLCGFSAFLWDGIFIGATATRQMLYSMLVASGTFFIMYYLFINRWGIMRYGWLSFGICLYVAVCNGYFGG